MALIGIWYRNFWDYAAQAVIPYDQRLARFPAYLQQLEMESNGKSRRSRRRGGAHAHGAGDLRRARHQCAARLLPALHQGTEIVPVDFLLAAEPLASDPAQHHLLVANCLAQSEALIRGRSRAEVEAKLTAQGLDESAVAALAPHKVFAGNRPSSTLLYRQPDAAHARPADRALRAQGLRPIRHLEHRSLRPMGRRTRQGTGAAAGAARRRRRRRDSRPRCFDGRPHCASARAAAVLAALCITAIIS